LRKYGRFSVFFRWPRPINGLWLCDEGPQCLPEKERSNLLHQWAELESAGTPAAQTAATLAGVASHRYRPALTRFQQRFSAGSAPALAAQSEGLLRDWEAKVVDATYESGRLEAGLPLLADESSARAADGGL
jgi:hypothetical protein